MNEIYVWNGKVKPRSATYVHVVIRDMRKPEVLEEYREGGKPRENARNIARMLMNGVPSDTNDVLFKAIADEIRSVLAYPKLAELLAEPHDIENRIRGALEDLAR